MSLFDWARSFFVAEPYEPANPGRDLALKQHADNRAQYRATVDRMNREAGRPAVRWPGAR